MMRAWGVALLLVSLMSSSSHALCRYFRTAYQVERCQPTSAETPDTFADTPAVSTGTVLPGLEETPLGPTDHLTCSCEYVLQGSDLSCDQERTQEFSQTYPQDKDSPVCRRGKSLCASVCPKRIL